jgi:mannose-6-phosphate isomerase-like protein (cupin superfamily)
MFASSPPTAELSDAWIEGDESARWRSTAGAVGEGCGSSILEVDPGCRLPRHTDSAEELVVVVSGTASVTVGDEDGEVAAGGVALVPERVPHEVRNAGGEVLRFVAVYASADVTTTYEVDVQPDGGRERDPLG